ncbi:MAG TPA: lipopolysaccharide biosynthesis protein [Porphyromonadaceae bacterium]|jgi:FixJ family two-component response regulator|nr:lipopolysaccharide biosynthesis protein [Porphyromonadaceae bacterium]HBX18972.1 lipopolysaccharide biosynthesis protein [Porphyromonadaceae bacterium]
MSSQTSLPPSADLPPAVQEDEIDLVDILRRLWLKRRFILWVTGAFLLLGVFIALFSPVKYTASCTVVPQSGKDGSGGNLGGIAAMMGVNMGGMGSSETLSPTVYPQIIKSVPFTREIMQTPIRVEKSGGKSISLYDYYTDKQYQSFNLLDGIKRYTIGLPGLLIGAIRGTPVQEASTDSVSTMLALTDEEERVYKTIQSSLTQNFNQKDGYLTLEYSFPEAEGAAQITDQVRKTLGKYVISFKSEKAEDNLAFVEQSYEDARKDFLEKQSRLASFRDANRGLTTATAQATEQRLRSEYDLAFSVYSELAKQREQAKLSVKETKPVLTVIEPVVVPSQKSAPRRGIILIGFLFFGLVVGCAWVFIEPVWINIQKGIGKENSLQTES